MKLILDEWIVREVIDTLYMARTTFLGITGLDSPQEVEKKSANETAITRRISKAIDMIQQSEQSPVPNDLEEAAWGYASKECEKAAFIAGAEWQAEQLLKSSPLPEDTVLFNKGVEEGKRLMMSEAVEIGTTEIYWEPDGDRAFPTFDPPVEDLLMPDIISQRFKEGDKVRIIIVKENNHE